MNTVFARALFALTLVALPAAASTKETKVEKAKHETRLDKPKHGHAHAAVAKKDLPGKKAKHGAHKAKDSKGVTAAPVASAAKAP